MERPPATYRKWMAELKQSIQLSRASTQLRVNSDMLLLYWYIGRQLQEKIDVEGWGSKIVDLISADLQKSFPDIKGFSAINLLYMKQYSAAWPDLLIPENEITQQSAAQIGKGKSTTITQQSAAQIGNRKFLILHPELISIPWGHHIYLLDKSIEQNAYLWYVQKTIENNWTRNLLQFQVDTDLYVRQHKKSKANISFLKCFPGGLRVICQLHDNYNRK
jgi:predicted nuclease of restriction endonuclease-like (RecB) superfamily